MRHVLYWSCLWLLVMDVQPPKCQAFSCWVDTAASRPRRRKTPIPSCFSTTIWTNYRAKNRNVMELSKTDSNSDKENNHANNEVMTTKSATSNNREDSSGSSSASSSAFLSMQQQAEKLRAEVARMRNDLDTARAQKLAKEMADVDRWIDEVLIKVQINEDTQMLHSVEEATQLLRDGRFSHEQVYKMFDRICERTGPAGQSRSRCSPLLALLVDAAGKLDEVDREVNPNKRWSGRVERDLRKRLFAMDWGIRLENNQEDPDPRGLL